MKIAVVGSGIAGLTAAWLFQRAGHRVSLFEKRSSIGLDSHRVPLGPNGQFGDVPSRMFNALHWPKLVRLYQLLDVETQAVNATQSFSRLGGKKTTYLKLDVAYWPKLGTKALFDSEVRQIMAEASRLRKEGTRDLADGLPRSITLGQYLQDRKYKPSFVYSFLYPSLSSTVCTCSYACLDQYPAQIILQALANLTGDQRLLRTKHGTAGVVNRLMAGIEDIHLDADVTAIQRTSNNVLLGTRQGLHESFDHALIATQANHVAKIMEDLSTAEAAMLESFVYENVSVAVHSDPGLMPANKRDWSTFNMMVADGDGQARAAMCSVWMNQFHGPLDIQQEIFQTINPILPVHKSTLIASIELQRPVVDQKSLAGLSKLQALHCQPDRRVWFCGSYASQGIPLLETGVVSILKIANHLNIDLPRLFFPAAPIKTV